VFYCCIVNFSEEPAMTTIMSSMELSKNQSLRAHLLIIVVVVIICSLIPSSESDCVGPISDTEYVALEALFDSTDGENWRWLPDGGGVASHWHFPATLEEPCGTDAWEGLRCNVTDDASQCYISDISLESHSLVGTIPSALGTLTRLEVLGLAHNNLEGSLPAEIGGMGSLITLDLQYNYLSLQLPSELSTLDSLISLYLDENMIQGTIPVEICGMTRLFGLYLESNYLGSSIPTELGTMRSLGELFLRTNQFTNSIPTELCSLRSLIRFAAYENLLTGTIPSCIGEMTRLHMFSIFLNTISGPLPPQMGSLSNLLEFNCKDNLLTGYLPMEIYDLDKMEQLLLTANFLSGTLPSAISSLTSAYQINIATNLFSGAIPSELFTITGLTTLFVDYNYLSSTIPDALFGCKRLEYFAVGFNELIGTLPDLFDNISKLQYLTLASNYLSGTLPATIFGLVDMKQMTLAGNYFTGTVCSLSNFSNLEFINFGGCWLTGSFPPGFSELTKLKSFTTESNYLSGSLKLPLSSSRIIVQDLEIGSNYFSGSLPAELASFGRVEEFLASHNLLTGKIDFLFNRTVGAGLGELQYVDLSNNALSGTIPQAMFVGARFRPLSVVVLYQNCFTGSLPEAICQAGNLTTLILDSVSSAPACDFRFTGVWKDLFKVVIGKRSLQGTIPDCIWSMPSLQTVHLAGNGLHGTLPADVLSHSVTNAAVTNSNSENSIPANQTAYALNDVNLASNVLVGTIPLSWQQWPWKSLDLSGNKLTGILSEGFVVNNTCAAGEPDEKTNDDNYAYYDDGGSVAPSFVSNASQICGNIDVTVNRLSGRIPGAFHYAEAVNILDGNLFDCDGHTMPESDPTTSEYICGSSDFNNSLILWLCLFVFGFTVLFSVSGRALSSKIKYLLSSRAVSGGTSLHDQWVSLHRVGDGRSVFQFLSFLRRIAALSLTLLGFHLFVCMVSYVGMKASDKHYEQQESGSTYIETFDLSTHTYQYAWLSTAAYLHGSIPVVVIMLFLFISLFVTACFLSDPNGAINTDSLPAASEYVPNDRSRTTSVRTLNGPIKQLHQYESDLAHKGSLRETCLTSTVDTGSSEVTPPLGPSVSWFTGVRLVVLIVIHAVVMISINILYIYILLTGLSSNVLLFLVQLGLSVFKLLWNRHYVGFVIAAPLVSTAAQSTNASVGVPCYSFMVLFTFVISPVLATFFSDNTCFRYFITGQPAVESSFQTDVYECYIVCSIKCESYCEYNGDDQVTVVTSVVPSWQYSYQCSSSLLVNYTPVLLYSYAITGLLVPLLQYLYCQLSSETIARFVPPGKIARYVGNTIYAYKNPELMGDEVLEAPSRSLFNGISVISRAHMNIGVLLTFGLASPLLGIAVCMDSVNLYLVWEALIQRYLFIFVFSAFTETSELGDHVNGSDSHAGGCSATGYLKRLTRATNFLAVEDAVEAEASEAVSAGAGTTRVLWLVVWIAGLFWGLFVFDMYGDIYGAVDGLCMILVPTIGGTLIFYVASRYHRLKICCSNVCRMCFSSRSTDTVNGRSVKSPIFDPQGNASEFYEGKL
jgi:Leucine-rich repeat (LRR) protein